MVSLCYKAKHQWTQCSVSSYFNYYTRIAESPWERRSFLRGWWNLYADDSRHVPPYQPALQRVLRPEHTPHLARVAPSFHFVEALPGRGGRGQNAMTSLMEETVSAAILFRAPQHDAASAYLGLLRVANDHESLERLLSAVMEGLWQQGARRLTGPTGLSPFLYSGVLHNCFDQLPPLHTAYNPPYLPDLIQRAMQPLAHSHLYRVTVPPQPAAQEAGARDDPARLSALNPRQLAHTQRPLMAAACDAWPHFPKPDTLETTFLLDQLGHAPIMGWLARVHRQPVGFILLQPDLAASLRRANGARTLLWRLWFAWRATQPTTAGRLVFGGVLPAWRGRGVGSQLWQQALHTAQSLGWRSLTIGPVVDDTPGAKFLARRGAEPQQSYWLYALDL